MAEAHGRRITRGLLFAFVLATGLVASASAQPVGIGSPSWAQLPPGEKQVLAPLAPDWDKWDAQRKAKWRGIAQRYPQMAPDQQQRIQRQMAAWAQLSPEQRNAAREQYKTIKTLPPDKKKEVQQKWEQYQSLPPETKQHYATKPVPAPSPAPPGGRTTPRAAPTAPPPPAPASPPPSATAAPPPVK